MHCLESLSAFWYWPGLLAICGHALMQGRLMDACLPYR